MTTDPQIADALQVFTADELATRCKISRTTFDRFVSRGDFPEPDIRRGRKFVRWSYATAKTGIEQLSAAATEQSTK